MNLKETLRLPLTAYSTFVVVAGFLQSPVLLLIRLIWGGQFIMTGWGKLNHLQKVTEFFATLGIPFPAWNAPFVASVECVGGFLLVVGLFSRLAAIPLAITLIMAYLTAEFDTVKPLLHGEVDPFFSATPFLYLFAMILIIAFGPGAFSLDHLLRRFLRVPTKTLGFGSMNQRFR